MNQLDWLSQRRFMSVVCREYDWVFVFDAECSLVVECLWRLIENDRIKITSEDHNQQFGLPTPIDASAHLAARLANRSVVEVVLCEGTLDIHLNFGEGCVLEIIPDSSGYEAWSAQSPGRQFVAVGGGSLTEFRE